MKWIAPLMAYLAVGIGLLQFRSAWGALIGFHAAIIGSLLIARPEIPIKILLRSSDPKWIFISIVLCGSSGVTLYFFWNDFGFTNHLSTQIESLGLSFSNWFLFITYFALVNPLVEEYFWRGYLGNLTRGLHISDFLYAGFHALILVGKMRADSIAYALTLLIVAGWFWRQIFREDQGLLAPVLSHMAADFSILMAVYLKF